MRTLIQGGWVVGFDGRGHTLIPDGVVVYEDRDILFVGRQFDGQVDKRVDASGQLVSPGLINCHIHAESNAPHILLTDHAKTDYFGENFLAYGAFKRGGRPSFQSRANVEGKFAAWMAVRGGATTVLDAGARPQALEPLTHMIGELGVRAYLGPGYRAASHVVDERGAIQLEWLPDGGMEGLEAAKAYVREFEGRYDGRIRTMLYPNQTVSCGPDLLKATKAAAGELGVGIQLHAAQGLPEFHISLREYGVTPIQMLHEAGFLGPEVTLAHCIFDAGHLWCHYPYADDLGRLADAGVSIAHSPYKYAKMGIHAESFDRWRQRGINVCLGTDTFPQDIVAEMRWAAMGSRLAEGNYLSGQPRDVFDAATLGGAKSLGRTDIGRLAAGAKADILILNLRQIHFGGVRDPIASVVESATSSDVSSVIVDGRTLIENGQALALDEDRLLADLQSGCKEYWAGVSQWRARGESLDEIAPMSYPLA